MGWKRRPMTKAERIEREQRLECITWTRLTSTRIKGWRGRFRIEKRYNVRYDLTDIVSGMTKHRTLREAKRAAELILARERERDPLRRALANSRPQISQEVKDEMIRERLREANAKLLATSFPCLSGHRHRDYATMLKCDKRSQRNIELSNER